MKNEHLTPSETLVMKCIWDAEEELSMSQILERVNSERGKEWKPQTVSTFLAKLVQKGYIKMRRTGHRVTYEILVSEEIVLAQMTDDFVSFWNGGSVGAFLTAYYRGRKVTKEELDELRKVIDRLDKSNKR